MKLNILQKLRTLLFLPLYILDIMVYYIMRYIVYGDESFKVFDIHEKKKKNVKLPKSKKINTLEKYKFLKQNVLHLEEEVDEGDENEEKKKKIERSESFPYRNIDYIDSLLVTPMKEVESMSDLFKHVVDQYGDKKLFGQRNLLKIHKREKKGKQWELYEFKGIKWYSYNDIYNRVINVSKGLNSLLKLKTNEKIGFYENTCMEWQIMLQSCFKLNLTGVTAYSNLGNDALVDIINENSLKYIFTGESLLKDFEKDICDKCDSLKYIIYNKSTVRGISSEERKEIEKVKSKLKSEKKVKLISFEDIENNGKNINSIDMFASSRAPDIDSIALIMYTSGTTNKPKGVILSNKNILSAISSIHTCVGDISEEERQGKEYSYVAYLPLAHILELAAQHVIMIRGGYIGFGSPKTISPKSIFKNGKTDLQEFNPSIVVVVPKIIETMKKNILETVEKKNILARSLFYEAVKARLWSMKYNRETPLWNYLVFDRIKTRLLGDQCFIILSGGAPLNKNTQEFARACFGTCVVQGFGLTETAAASHIQIPFEGFETGKIGCVVPSCQIKLISCPELKYSIDDKPCPRGEIAIAGPSVSSGYFNMEKKTKESFIKGEDDNVWFLTGDIGTIDENGIFSIIDRKKNLCKTGSGEYVAVEKIESVYSNSEFISPNGIMVHVDSNEDDIIALIVPQKSQLKSWAQSNNVEGGDDFESLCKNKKVNEVIMKSMQKEAEQANLKSFEQVKKIALISEEWTPENGLLTAASKLKRKAIVEKYQDKIDELYGREDNKRSSKEKSSSS